METVYIDIVFYSETYRINYLKDKKVYKIINEDTKTVFYIPKKKVVIDLFLEIFEGKKSCEFRLYFCENEEDFCVTYGNQSIVDKKRFKKNLKNYLDFEKYIFLEI
jgi:hypothetical protein